MPKKKQKAKPLVPIAKICKGARLEAGLTQAQFGEPLGLLTRHICEIERGNKLQVAYEKKIGTILREAGVLNEKRAAELAEIAREKS